MGYHASIKAKKEDVELEVVREDEIRNKNDPKQTPITYDSDDIGEIDTDETDAMIEQSKEALERVQRVSIKKKTVIGRTIDYIIYVIIDFIIVLLQLPLEESLLQLPFVYINNSYWTMMFWFILMSLILYYLYRISMYLLRCYVCY